MFFYKFFKLSVSFVLPKTPVELGNVCWRRGRVHDKTGEKVVFVMCTAGAFIGCVDNVKVNR